MRLTTLLSSVLAGLLLVAGCRMAAPQRAGQKEAVRANELSNKHILTETPTLEHPAPKPPAGP